MGLDAYQIIGVLLPALVTFVMIGADFVQGESGQRRNIIIPGGTQFIALFTGMFVAIFIRHVYQLKEVNHHLVDNVVILFITIVTFFGCVVTFDSLDSKNTTKAWIISIIVSSIVALSTIIVFSSSNSPISMGATKWFIEYFPYENAQPKKVFFGIVVFTITSLLTLFILRNGNEKRKVRVAEMVIEGLDPDAIEKVANFVALGVSLIITMIATGVNLPTISVVGGIFIAGIGFAGKEIITNIAACIVLIWDGSFKTGDVISTEDGKYGIVDKLTLRHVVIKDRDEMSLIVPYSKLLKDTIQNWSHDDNLVRLKVDIGIEYSADNLEEIQIELAEAARRANDRIVQEKSPRVNVMRAGDSAIELQVRFYIRDPEEGIRNVMSDVIKSIIRQLKQMNISVPYPTIDLNIQRPKAIDNKAA